MKVLILVTDFAEPWDEGGKNNVRALAERLNQRWDLSFLGLSRRTERRRFLDRPVRLIGSPWFGRRCGRLTYPLGCVNLVVRGATFAREQAPDLIFSYLETASAALVARTLRELAAPRAALVHTVWNDWYDPRSAPPSIWLTEHVPNALFNSGWLARMALESTDLVLATSRYLVDRVQGLGVQQVAFTPTGVDVRRFEPRRPVAENPPVTLGYLGHLTHAKGVTDLLSAVPILDECGARLTLAVTTGEEKAALLRVSHPRVHVEGPVDPVEYLNRCDLVVIPRRSSYGSVSYPNTLLEAMACGRPVVVTDLPAIREVVTDGVEGVLVPPGRPEVLRERLVDLLRHPSRLKEMGARARMRVERDFDWAVLATQTALVVEERVAGRERR